MPNSTEPSRRDAPSISDASLAALLAGAELPPGAAPELRPLADALAVLAGRPDHDELAGEADTLTAFRDHFSTSARFGGSGQFGAPGTAHRRGDDRMPRRRYRPAPLRAAAAAVTILGLGGLATAAYAGALPTGLQRLAHDIIGAPTPGARPAAHPSSPEPAATGPGYGLCAAWAHAKADGTRQQRAAAFAALAAAAGGPGNVTAYCRTAAHPTPRPSGPAATPSPRSGKPTALPAPHGSGMPTAIPTPHGTGKPTAIPTPHATGKPTAIPTPHGTRKPTAVPTPHGSARPGG
jgi:hypothetical protein